MTLLRPVESYAGTALNTFVGTETRLRFWVVDGLDDGLEIRGVDSVIPGAAGRVPRNRLWDRRVVEIAGWVRGVGASDAARADDFRDAMETLRTLFDPTRVPASLVIGLEGGVRTATISCRPLPTILVGYKPVPAASINVEFEAVEGDWLVAESDP